MKAFSIEGDALRVPSSGPRKRPPLAKVGGTDDRRSSRAKSPRSPLSTVSSVGPQPPSQRQSTEYGVAKLVKAFIPADRDNHQLGKELVVKARTSNKKPLVSLSHGTTIKSGHVNSFGFVSHRQLDDGDCGWRIEILLLSRA